MIGPIHAREYYFAKAAREIAEAARKEQALFDHPSHLSAEDIITPFQEWAKELEEGARDPGLFRLMACRALLLTVHFERLKAGEGNIPPGQTEKDEAFDEWLTRIPGAQVPYGHDPVDKDLEQYR